MLLNFINEYLNLFIFSFLFNFTIFYIVKSGLLGNNLKIKLNIILKPNINLITFISFFLFLFVSLYLNMYKLHLDNYRIACNNVPLQPTWDTIKKTGLIQVILENSSNKNNLSNLTNCVNEKNTSSSLLEHFNKFTMNNTQLTENTEKLNNGTSQITINGKTEASSKILNELEKIDPNWKDNFFVKSQLEIGDARNNFIIDNFFIKSPLENGDAVTKFFIETLTDNLLLHFIILYFIVILTIIIICKLNLPKEPQFPKIKRLPFGNLIHKLLTYYLSVWQISSHFWIYLILFFLFLFNLGSLISITKMLIYFKSL